MAAAISLENTHLRMRISPLGGALLSLESLPFAVPVLRPGEGKTPGDCGLFPMLPLANRVAGNRFWLSGQVVLLPDSRADAQFFLHGDGWLAEWDVTGLSDQCCTLQLCRRHACGFDYLATLDYRLNGPVLEIAVTLQHLGETPMLYGGGLHPFFHFTPQSRLQFCASGYWPEGPQHLPLAWQNHLPPQADFNAGSYGDDEWLNICYSGWGGQATILHPQMRVTLSAQPGWLMLFRQSGEPFVCLEPQSHPVNAHNMPGQPGLGLLQKNEIWRFFTSIVVEPASIC